jgi:hypothetical protein
MYWFQFPEAFMNKMSFPRFLCAGLLFLLAGCQTAQPSSRDDASRPGETVAGMSLTTGMQGSRPLQALCSPTQWSSTSMTAECSVPASSRLPIGQVFMLADHGFNSLNRSEITWDMAVDDQPLDLEAFGTVRYVIPDMPSSPSSIKEVFRMVDVWDVVLTDLAPGEHIVTGHALYGTNIYTWVIHVSIQDNPQLQ